LSPCDLTAHPEEDIRGYQAELDGLLLGQTTIASEERQRLNALRRLLHIPVAVHVACIERCKWTLIDFLDGEKSSTDA
jgi:hypothetical protein